jgi:hypothetical protein
MDGCKGLDASTAWLVRLKAPLLHFKRFQRGVAFGLPATLFVCQAGLCMYREKQVPLICVKHSTIVHCCA